MNVLILTPRLNEPGGVANYYKTIKKHFPSSVEYFFVGNDGDKSKLQKIIRSFLDYLIFFKKILLGSYNIVHLNPSLGYKSVIRDAIFLIILKMFKVEVVVFFRGWNLSTEKIILSNIFYKFLFRKIFLKVKKIIILSSEFELFFKKLNYKGSIYLETTVVDDSFVVEELNDDSNRHKNILFLSRIERDKGVFKVVDSFIRIKHSYPDCRLYIAGEGPDKEELLKYLKELNDQDIVFMGYVRGEEKKDILRKCGIYAFPTLYGEGMPNALLEAMAFSMVAITSPSGGIKDIFIDQEMGALIDGSSSEELDEALCLYISSPQLSKNIGENNRGFISRKCTASIIVKRLMDIYMDGSTS
jgi:glycosyltransferase involved in cell wall biosynthesis